MGFNPIDLAFGHMDVLQSDNERLKAENAKLREDLEFERSENGWAREFLNCIGPKCGTKDCPSLVAYVTRLRELVRIAIEYCVNGYCEEEDGCPLYESRYSCRLCAEARKLGIEVE